MQILSLSDNSYRKASSICLVVCLALVAMGEIFSLSALSLAGALGLCATCLAAPIERLVLFLVVMAPSDSMLMVGGSVSATTVSGMILFAKLVIREKDAIKFSRLVLLGTIGIALFSLVGSLYTGDEYISSGFKFAVLLLAFSMLLDIASPSVCVERLSKAFIFGCILMAIFALVNLYGGFDDYPRLRALGGDPNYSGVYFAFASTLCLPFVFRKDRFDIAPFSILLFVIFCGALTQSRGFFVCVLPTVFYLVAKLALYIRKYAAVAIAILLIFVLLYVMMGDQGFIGEMVERFTAEETRGGSGRISVWLAYLNLFAASPLNFIFGVSTLDVSNAVNSVNVLGIHNIVAHNLYVEVLCMHGFLFAISYIGVFVGLYSQMKRRAVSEKRYSLPLVTVLIGYFFLNGALNIVLVVLLFLSGCSLYGGFAPSSAKRSNQDLLGC